MKFYKNILGYQVTTGINNILYFFKNFPFLRVFFVESNYRLKGLKRFAIKLAPLYLILKKVFFTLLKYSLLYLLILAISTFFDDLAPLKNLIFVNATIILKLLNLRHFTIEEDIHLHYIFYRYFNVDIKSFTIKNLYFKSFIDFCSYLILLLLFKNLFEIIAIDAIVLSFIFVGANIIINSMKIRIISKNIESNYEKSLTIIHFLAVLVGIFILVLASVLKINLYRYIYEIFLVFIPLFILSIKNLNKNNKYEEIINRLSTNEVHRKANDNKEKLSKVNEIKKEDFKASKNHLKTELRGYDLLNELFFQRHRRRILKPILIKSGLVLLAFTFLAIARYLPIPDMIKSSISENFLGVLISVTPFTTYMLFFDLSIISLMFINCDQALMQYGFYRRPKDLLQMFKKRLEKLLLWNSLISLSLIIGLSINLVIWGLSFSEFFVFFIQIISLQIFFSVHTLFIYYIFQPFNGEYEMKSTGMAIINSLVYMACYITLRINTANPRIPFYYIGAAFLYVLISIILIYKKAPDTFKPKTNN